ncbi:MAG: SDR family NAD(P)-dependent oxidoreductase, partial [Paraglaciecola sp.]|nr:SDR family NAD(P)-dependent oxidoreductase [Paraglaciecola sp.]
MLSKNILITGGASGIGFGIAQQLATLGHQIIIADLQLNTAQEAARKLSDAGYSTSAIAVDVSQAEHVAALPGRLSPLKIDVLINNAGIQHVSRIEDFPADKWQQLINIMLVGPALMTQAFL